MSTHVARSDFEERGAGEAWHREHDWTRFLAVVGRVLFAAIFIMTVTSHFSAKAIGYAASQGVPFPNVLVPLSGILATAGGLSVALGYRAKLGAWLIVLFLVPVTFMMHRFWAMHDPQMVQLQQAMFMKNVSMLGGALLVAYFGAGPLSIDARRNR
jgi:putative oxidoreductase